MAYKVLRTDTWQSIDCRGYSVPVVVGIYSVDVGVRMADHAHADVLSDLPALQVGDHGMPETMKTLPGHLVLPALGIAGVDARLGHYADKGLAKTAAAPGKGFAHGGQHPGLGIADGRRTVGEEPSLKIRVKG